MSTFVWQDGRLLGADEPTISPMSHAFTVGDGAFETIGLRGGDPFAVTRHLARLGRSLATLGLGVPDVDAIREGIASVLEAGAGSVGRLRITVTSGPGPLGSVRAPGPLTAVVAGGPGAPAREGAVVRSPWRRNEFSPTAGVKSTSYADNVVLANFARDRGADEALVQNTAGDVCEGSGSNVFVEVDGAILTPQLKAGCLGGITRGLALEWGTAAGIPVREAEPGELPWAILDRVARGEASLALTSATRAVQPVTRFDGEPTVPGPLIGALREEFERRAEADHDPAPAPA